MVFGPFDLSNARQAELLFHYWNRSGPDQRGLGWFVSVDGSQFYGTRAGGDSQGWRFVNFDLANVPTLGNVTGASEVWIAFVSEENSGNGNSFVDDVELRVYEESVGGSLTVSGYWYYRDRNGVDRILPYAKVEIWDDDLVGDDLLATTHTNASGFYQATFTNSDVSNGVDVFARVLSTDDYSVSVRSGGNLYSGDTAVTNDVQDGSFSIGSYSLTHSTNRAAWYLYDKVANDAWSYLKNTVGWDNNFNIEVRWSPTSTAGAAFYGSYIELNGGDGWDEDVLLHEYGHFVMFKTYSTFPSAPSCNPHIWGMHTSLGCAWVEGWATFLGGAIQNSPTYIDSVNQNITYSMESPPSSVHHPEDEGSINASLWDIFDSGSSESWDTLANSINGSASNGIWKIVNGQDPNHINEFRDDWYASSNGFSCQVGSIIDHFQVAHNSPGHSLTTSVSPGGTGSVSTSPSSNCVGGEYAPGTTVNLTGNPATGYAFSFWSGAASGSANSTNITMSANRSVTANFAFCYTLSRAHTGSGSDPSAAPSSSPGCPSGRYVGGAQIQLTASPSSGWNIGSWSGTNSNGSTSTSNSVTMPAGNHTVSVNYVQAAPTCYTLSRTHTGSGSDPSATPSSSSGCPSGQYTAGASIQVTASPSSGWSVGSWSGTNSNGSTSTSNSVTMPAGSHTVSVNYVQAAPTCYTLSRTHTGSGSDPSATPSSSSGCSSGRYTAGASIQVTASPSSGWSVGSWGGTTNNGSTSTSNSVTMPAGNHTVSVNYVQASPTCYTLSRTHTGSGSDPSATPSSSSGCSAGQYTAGASIQMAASPSSGWNVGSWSGTNNNGSTSTSNSVTMPAGNHTVSVNYVQAAPTCYTLSRTHTGSGSDPSATPSSSSGCSSGRYTAGASIQVTASPSSGWIVENWSGTNNNGSTSTSNTVTMPSGNHTVAVSYVQTPTTSSTILLVDDDDDNPNVESFYRDALAALGKGYDVWYTGNSDSEPGASALQSYKTVIWFTGDEFGGAAGPGSAGEAALGAFLGGGSGRCMILSSQDYLFDRGGATPFMTGFLGLNGGNFADDVGHDTVSGQGSAFTGLGPYVLSYPGSNFSDRISPAAGAELAFLGDGGDAAVSKIGPSYRTVFLGFPFEAIPTPETRRQVMAAALDFCATIFADVPPKHWARPWVEALYRNGVTQGCGVNPRVYCPETDVTRNQMAYFLLRAKEGNSYAPPPCTTPPFNDVPVTSTYCPWVQELKLRGITNGCGNGSFCPDSPVTRQQAAFFLLTTVQGSSYTPPPCTTPPFSDVPVSSSYCPWIRELAARGLTSGCGGGNYCPLSPVTRAQMAKFLITTFGLPLF